MRFLAFAASAALLLASPAWAQSDPFRDGEAADAAAAADPAGDPHRARAMSLLRDLELDESASFAVLNVNRDRRGGEHVRLQQYHDGIPVRGGVLLSHWDPRAGYGPYTDAVVRGLPRFDRPRVSSTDAILAVERDPDHLHPFAWTPRARLLILPQHEWRSPTGAPPRPLPVDPEDYEPEEGDLTADDLVQVLTGASLVWEVKVLDDPGDRTRLLPSYWYVDAATGAVVRRESGEQNATARSFWSGPMPVDTQGLPNACSRRMYDAARKIHVIDHDYGDQSGPNCDSNDDWGDGQIFQGDLWASNANRQTAIADGMVGSRIFWNMLSNVFNRQGYNDQGQSMSVNVHEGTLWDDASYNNINNSVFIGDGTTGSARRQARDCLGHEHGHGLNDSTASLGGGGEGSQLNESIADILGEMTDAYYGSGNYAIDADWVGDVASIASVGGSAQADVPYRNVCSGRDMLVRWTPGNKAAIFWNQDIGKLEEHAGSVANSRAFAILALGAGNRLGRAVPPNVNRLPPYSSSLPWGAPGVGFDDASVIAYYALTCWLAGGSYKQMRKAMLDAAAAEFGSDSAQYRAVQNAYAAINVGQRAPGTPTALASVMSNEPDNNSFDYAQDLNAVLGSPPAGASAGAPDKVRVIGMGNTTAWFQIGGPGQYIAARVRPTDAFTKYKLELYDGFGTKLATGTPWFTSQIVRDTIGGFGDGARYLKVTRTSGIGAYYLEVEAQ